MISPLTVAMKLHTTATECHERLNHTSSHTLNCTTQVTHLTIDGCTELDYPNAPFNDFTHLRSLYAANGVLAPYGAFRVRDALKMLKNGSLHPECRWVHVCSTHVSLLLLLLCVCVSVSESVCCFVM